MSKPKKQPEWVAPTIPATGLIVLGIDPGTTRVGIGRIRLFSNGTMEQYDRTTVAASGSDVVERLFVLREKLKSFITICQTLGERIDVWGVEQPMYAGKSGPMTRFLVGGAWANVCVTIKPILRYDNQHAFCEVTPSMVAWALGLKGNATKSERREKVAELLNVDWSHIKDSDADADACDALGVACYIGLKLHAGHNPHATDRRTGHRTPRIKAESVVMAGDHPTERVARKNGRRAVSQRGQLRYEVESTGNQD